MTTDLFQPLSLPRGPQWRNRFALAPLTNLQSHADGRLSDDEIAFLVRRAEGGFGLVMTAAAQVSPAGQAWPGQLATHGDVHLPGLERLAGALAKAGAVSAVQLHHGGEKASRELAGGVLLAPWDDGDKGVRAMTTGEVEQVVADFIAAAVRCEKAGIQGVELHGAHGYLLCQFLSTARNRRTDRYGGSFENRTRIFREIIAGIRAATGPDFQLGLRLSPEKYEYPMADSLQLAQDMLTSGQLDYLDMSLWDSFKIPDDEPYHAAPLVDWFARLPRSGTRLGVAGKLFDARQAQDCLERGVDFVLIGRGAILHHDYPRQVMANPDFVSRRFPVSRAYLEGESLGPAFVDYLATGWRNYVSD